MFHGTLNELNFNLVKQFIKSPFLGVFETAYIFPSQLAIYQVDKN